MSTTDYYKVISTISTTHGSFGVFQFFSLDSIVKLDLVFMWNPFYKSYNTHTL